jgi:DNA polymerase-1
VAVYDAGGNWRKEEDTEYKADREKSSLAHYADMNLLVEDVLPSLGFTPVGVKGYEADDVIAHISRHSPAYEEIHILTCDRDLLSCVTNKVKVLLFNSAKKMELTDIDWILEKEGVYPAEIKYKKSLCGDSSDNVKGIKGIGPKTAVKIIEESRPKGEDDFMSGADRIAFHPKVKDNAATFYANLRLVTLENDVPDLRWFASSAPNLNVVKNLFEGLGFKSYLKPARLTKILKSLKVEAG